MNPNVLDRMVMEGRATEATCDLLDLMRELGLPKPAPAKGQLPSQALAELRTDETSGSGPASGPFDGAAPPTATTPQGH